MGEFLRTYESYHGLSLGYILWHAFELTWDFSPLDFFVFVLYLHMFFQNLRFKVDTDTRVAIVGPNGVGEIVLSMAVHGVPRISSLMSCFVFQRFFFLGSLRGSARDRRQHFQSNHILCAPFGF